MGNARHNVYIFGQKIEAGYGVPDVCNDDVCAVVIDRGAYYLCGRHPGGDEYGCGWYFCASHLYYIEVDGELVQVCANCRKYHEQEAVAT